MTRLIFSFFLLCCCCVSPLPLAAQTSIQLHLVVTDTTQQALEKQIDWPAATYPDSNKLYRALARTITNLHQAAYWEASIDTVVQQGSTYTAFLHRGPRYIWGNLSTGRVPTAWLNRAGFRPNRFRRRLDPVAWQRLRGRLLLEAGKRGFPFATLQLDSISWQDNGVLSAQMALDKGPLIKITDVTLPEEAGVKGRFLQNYLDVHPGDLYHQGRIEALASRIRELPYLQLQTSPTIEFVGEEATLHLPLTRRRASRFDFIIGVLPNSNQTGKLLITGQLDAELQNSLGRGELLAISFDQLRPLTQQLAVAVEYPYLLNLPFGVDLQFDLYRRDTNYVNLTQEIGLRYLLDGQRSVKVYYSGQRTNLLTVDSAALTRSGRLPDTLDVSRSAFGLEYRVARLDYRNNPRKGTAFDIRASAGTKRIRRNNRIAGLGLETLYDSLTLTSAQYRLEWQGSWYVPLGAAATFLARLRSGIIFSPDPILANEQFRIGGNRLLRGFDEESIFATSFHVATLEARYLFSENSYAYLFTDIARVDSKSQANTLPDDTLDFPIGLGAGITFDTPAGLFGLSLAFGKRQNLPFDPGKPRVHLGYINRF